MKNNIFYNFREIMQHTVSNFNIFQRKSNNFLIIFLFKVAKVVISLETGSLLFIYYIYQLFKHVHLRLYKKSYFTSFVTK